MGENFDGNPNFESPGAGTGKLLTRPQKYVPIKVPVFNEPATYEAQKALTKARQEGVEDLPDEVQPIYHWVYRPEMQFSVYDLKVKEILETVVPGGSSENLLNLENPVIKNDTVVDVLLTLMSPTNDPLEFFGPDRELILSIAGFEYEIALNADNEFSFLDVETKHLSELTAVDYLTIGIFLNNDSANPLWEFNFGVKPVAYPEFGDISADDSNQEILLVLPGFTGESEKDVDNIEKNVTLSWTVKG